MNLMNKNLLRKIHFTPIVAEFAYKLLNLVLTHNVPVWVLEGRATPGRRTMDHEILPNVGTHRHNWNNSMDPPHPNPVRGKAVAHPEPWHHTILLCPLVSTCQNTLKTPSWQFCNVAILFTGEFGPLCTPLFGWLELWIWPKCGHNRHNLIGCRIKPSSLLLDIIRPSSLSYFIWLSAPLWITSLSWCGGNKKRKQRLPIWCPPLQFWSPFTLSSLHIWKVDRNMCTYTTLEDERLRKEQKRSKNNLAKINNNND